MARTVPDTTLDEVARLIVDGVSIPKAQEQAGLGNATLYTKIGGAEAIRLWATKRMTPEAREQMSLRERVAHAIVEKGPFDSIGDLRDAIAQPRELIVFQAIVGAVWSLQKQGEVAVTQTSNTHMTNGHGTPDGGLKHIRALPSLYRRLGLPEPRKASEMPVTQRDRDAYERAHAPEPITVNPEPVHQNEKPESPAFPILVTLRAKATQVRKAREAVRLIEQAAELLSPDERARLLDEGAALISAHDLSPVEDEYLKYAEAHS